MMRWIMGAAAAGGLLLSACDDDEGGPTSRIFQAPAWDGAERFEYELYERNELDGFCTLESEPGADGEGTITLTTACRDAEGEGYRDDTVVVVDAETLEPIESERTLINPVDGTRTTMRGEYRPPDEVVVSRTLVDLENEEDVEEAFETTRDLPQPDEESPEPGWYDEASLFWLMRGIPLEEGWEGAYANMNVGIARLVVVDVEVDGQEEVEVPAGAFDTWTVRMESSVTNRFWVDRDAPHVVVQARLEDTRFELVARE